MLFYINKEENLQTFCLKKAAYYLYFALCVSLTGGFQDIPDLINNLLY